MKKILSTAIIATAATVMFGATAFGACPIKASQTSCSIGTPTGAAAPVSYIVAPVQQRTYLPACNNCNSQPAKKGFFSRMFSPVQGVYDATFGQIFTGLY